jgi:hypothetical protein
MKTITIEVPEKVAPRSPGEAEELNREVRRVAMLIGLDRGRISRDEAAGRDGSRRFRCRDRRLV